MAYNEGEVQVDLLLQAAQLRFLLTCVAGERAEYVKRDLLKIITDNNMLVLYDQLVIQFGWSPDESLRERMKANIEEQLTKMGATIGDAEANLGETEIRDGYLARAEFLYSIADKDAAVEAFAEVEKKTVAIGQKLDLVFYLLRLGLCYNDQKFLARQIERAKRLIDEGGDWEKRNRLKAYEGVFKLSRRDFAGAATLFLDTLATFTSYELMDMKLFVGYTAICSLYALDRVSLKKKVIDSPEVIALSPEVPHLREFVNCLYDCKYGEFLRALAGLSDMMKLDRFLSHHVQYYCREVRIKAYQQFLVSYRSVTVDTISRAFGVSTNFIDVELSRFIAMGRLDAKIDKVAGIVETQHRTVKNALYLQTIKQGDLLLNRVSKLARVTDM